MELISSLSEYIIKTFKYNFLKITRTMCKIKNEFNKYAKFIWHKLQILVRIIECQTLYFIVLSYSLQLSFAYVLYSFEAYNDE